MEVRELMNPSVVTIEPTSSASLAARLISRHNVGSLPVCSSDGRLRAASPRRRTRPRPWSGIL